ncbi:hypothetical protein SLE2022_015910 [Rubroshorea leprosula]
MSSRTLALWSPCAEASASPRGSDTEGSGNRSSYLPPSRASQRTLQTRGSSPFFPSPRLVGDEPAAPSKRLSLVE